MIKIENGILIVTLNGVDTSVQLPAVAADAIVKVWTVPTDYREDGLFVSVTQRGMAEDIPACDLTKIEFLGELKLEASYEAKLETLKVAKLDEINAAFTADMNLLSIAYPEREILSWSQQVKEAEAFAANPQAAVPLLAAIASARSLTVAELASRIMSNMIAFSTAAGTLIGRRQAAEDLISLAITQEDVTNIVW